MQLYKTIQNFIQHYRSLFLNPAGNSTEIIITTALIVVALVILWLLLTIVRDGLKGAWAKFRNHPRPWFVLAVIFGSALSLSAVILSGGYLLTSSSSFCGRLCHSMNPEYQSWRRSSHAGVSCVGCHTDRSSAAGVLSSRLRLATHGIVPEIRGTYSKPIVSRAAGDHSTNEGCVKCHESIRNSDVDKANLLVRHEEHVKSGVSCVTCHNRVAHADTEKYSPLRGRVKGVAYSDNNLMGGCRHCHKKGGRVVLDCQSCHPKNAQTQLQAKAEDAHRNHKEIDWRDGDAHGELARQSDFASCQVCHSSSKQCVECHQGITMPHEKNWAEPGVHGVEAKRVKPGLCQSCHKIGTVPGCADDVKNCHKDDDIL
jgi:nitrate/TMAO reductase-like tetraheme cytochrome c subunit